MIPCIKTKCLKYPVCKSIQIIECKLLANYISAEVHKMDDDIELWDRFELVMTEINRDLPGIIITGKQGREM